MRHLALALIVSIPSWASAGTLDLSYPAPKPDPTMAMVHALFVPGGGWFYTAQNTEDPSMSQTAQGWGAAFMAATAVSTWVMMNNAIKGDRKGLLFGLTMTLGLRYADIWGSTRRAHVTRYENRLGGSRESRETRESRDSDSYDRPARREPRRAVIERERDDERAPEPEYREPARVEEPAPEPLRKKKAVLPVWLE